MNQDTKLFGIMVLLAISFMVLFSVVQCSSEEEDTSSPPSIVITPKPEPEPEPTPAPTQYSLTVTAGEGGTVSTDGGTYNEGTQVTITATPNEGYQFVGWEGSDNDSSSLSITLNGNTTVQAIFERSLFVSKSESYSPINETTRYFSMNSSFKRYITLEEGRYLFQTTGNRFDGHDSMTFDIDNDGQLDLVWFGMNENIWSGGTHGNGKYYIISDYFNKTPPYNIIEFPSSVEFAAGGFYSQDIDNDNIKEILIFSHNTHQLYNDEFVPDHTNAPEELGTIILKIDENYNLIYEKEIGTPKSIHRGSSGDVDNDGDIDILNFPTGTQSNKTKEQKFPTILYNDGLGNFTEEFIFKNSFIEDYYWSMDSTTSHLFDIDGDGNLDLIFGQDIGTNPGDPPYIEGVNWFITEDTIILWGDGSGKFSWENKSVIPLKNELDCIQITMGMGFTDYDNDGDIDIVVNTTREYFNYILNLFENKGNRIFEDVTVNKIQGYYHFETDHLGDMVEIMSIDKDGDGDFDLVPRDPKLFCCYSAYDFVSDLYWENIGGSFVRRIND